MSPHYGWNWVLWGPLRKEISLILCQVEAIKDPAQFLEMNLSMMVDNELYTMVVIDLNMVVFCELYTMVLIYAFKPQQDGLQWGPYYGFILSST